MKIFSIDVGIKNLSFCLFDLDTSLSSEQTKHFKIITHKIYTKARWLRWQSGVHGSNPALEPTKSASINKAKCTVLLLFKLSIDH